ncbi:MAG: hypothetical protein R3278_04985, partial [Lysobacter spongiicola]|nr:hypothetical protein [Lysobacter spongiicola]
VLLLSRTGFDGAVESWAVSEKAGAERADALARLDHSAMIVDEAIGHPALAIQPDPDAPANQPGATAASATEASAASSASLGAQPDPGAQDNNPFVSGARSAPTTAARRPRAAKPASTAGAESESKLLAALLANIQSPPAEREASPLDVLLQDMAAKENAAGATAALGGQSRPTRRRSQQIQSNLRECPPANTAKGLACRQEICAVYAGRDPACPAG